VFVEIGADPRKFFSALNRVNKSLGNMGKSLVSGGGKLAAAGIGMAAPIAAAVRQGAAFESTLLNIRASTGATAGEIDQIKSSAMQMSKALGVGPTEAAKGMLELMKAGVPLETVLNGAGTAALQFAKVAELDGATAATVMSKAMNAFGVDSVVAANSMSAAADASATSIEEMAQAFSQASAVAATSNMSIDDLSASLAVLANKGIVGSDAGTSVKTMMQKLKVPTDEAVDALARIGLSFDSFRGADKQLLDTAGVIGVLENALQGVDAQTKDAVLGKVFGSDAIRAVTIFTQVGVDGFNGMKDAMSKALPVSEKYKMVMSGLTGSAANVVAGLQRLAIAVSDAVAPALASVVPFITGLLNGLTDFASNNKEAVEGFAKFAVAVIPAGAALSALGISLQLTSFGFAGIGKAAMLAISPLTLLIGGASGVANSFRLVAMPATLALANSIGAAMLSASAAVLSFASAAAAGIGSYLAAIGLALSGSIASAAGVAAAWLAPVAPLLLLSAAAIGVGIAIKQFGPQLADAFQGVSGYVSDAGDAISSGFSTAVSDGIIVLGDLAATATTTFNGVYEAVAAGDLAGAMDVLWAGLVAGWLRGVEALMSYVDPWVAAFQDVFTDIGSGVVIAWDKIYTDSAALLNTMGAFIMGFFDNIANGVMATFDNLVAGIQIAWTRVQGFITGAKDTEERVSAIKDENAARAEQRAQERPGIESRTGKAAAENAQAEKDRQDRAGAIMSGAEGDKAARQDENAKRAADRRAGVVDAETKLGDLTTAKQAERDAAKKAAEDIANTTGAGAASPGEKAATAGAGAAGADAATSKGEVAGTFSSVNLGGMGFGSSLAERTAKAAEDTAKGVKELVGQGGGKVAA
jgi:TP901 family phage tail tape measure protein